MASVPPAPAPVAINLPAPLSAVGEKWANRRGRKKAPRKLTRQVEKKPDGLTQQQLHTLDNQLLRATPSSPWRTDIRDDVVNNRLPYRSKMLPYLDKEGIFPPGGSKVTLMRVCPKCGRWMPPQYVVSDGRVVSRYDEICTDCLEIGRAPKDESERRHNVRDGHAELADGGTTSSPIAVAVDALEQQNAQLEEVKMLPEDDASLRRHIANYKATGVLAV